MPFQMIRQDIVEMRVDAIVNAANTGLQAGGGVCGAIFRAAGHDRLQAACDAIGRCPVGGAVITPGFDLPAKYVIHAVGPIWQGGHMGEAEKLRACYTNALSVAREHGLESVAFPLISAGIYGYPKREAMSIAVSAIGDFLLENDMQVYLVIFEREAFALGEKLQRDIKAYIDDHYADERLKGRRSRLEREAQLFEEMGGLPMQASNAYSGAAMEDTCSLPIITPSAAAKPRDLEDALSRVGEGFSERLFRLIDERGLTDPQVYKRANLDRKLFSKIRTKPDYKPGKNTVLSLCIALRLNLEQTQDLLRRAGLALSPGSKADLIVEYFIQNRNYNVYEINEALFAFDQELLGSKA